MNEYKKTVSLWDYTEISLEYEYAGNPFKDVQVSALFIKEGQEIEVSGFYDGKNQWKIRFMPTETGEWSFTTTSSLESLSGQKGRILCIQASGDVHGPVKVTENTHFSYADGTPYSPVGTTCYVWNLQGKQIEAKTLKTLKHSPFNKIRFCVYPKRYTFNYNEPDNYPFPGEVKKSWNPEYQDDYTPRPNDFWDFDSFNPEYFQHLDDCVLQLRELGIEADLILFHPYDFGAWGFDTVPEEVNTRLLKYLVARLGAFRNIWWSFANEYDFFQNKSIHEWDRYMRLVQETDPYQHLRSIHNWKDFFDHTKPWVTHCSIQSTDLNQVPQWLEKYNKPVVVDECGYEGNIDRDWGNISGKEMVHRFWLGFSSAAYVGHGETFIHSEDILWWSKGGELHGESPQRIAFLKALRESFPQKGIQLFTPGATFLKKPQDAKGCGVFPEFGLYYFGRHQPSFKLLDLPEDGTWEIEVIDTWEMTITSAGRKFSGKCRVNLPGKEGIALRVRKN